MRAVEVSEATEVDDELVAAFAALVPQLSSSTDPPSAAQLRAIVAAPACHLLVARWAVERDAAPGALPADADGRPVAPWPIVGTLTLVAFPIPTGIRAWIEDVVVDEAARGRPPGVVDALTEAALDTARRIGARTVELTSRPSRVAANRVYQRLGFALRETNVYRFALGG